MATTAVEKPKTRSDLAQLAGRGPFSLIAMLAGMLIGYGMFFLLLGGSVAILRSNGSQLDLSENWGDLSNRGGLLLGALLFVSYLLAGYIAGRMAWRRGAAHGGLVFLGSILVIGVVAALLRTVTQPEDVEGIVEALQRFGVPTTGEEWRDVGPVVWVASIGGMLLGSVLGGILGERWFTKVSRGALEAELDLRERMAATTAGNGHKVLVADDRDAAVEVADVKVDDVKVDEVNVDELSKEELYQRAQERDIPGRSHMNKEELKEALQTPR